MEGTWIERLRDRARSTWDVLTGRAYAAYGLPDVMSEARLRIALCQIQDMLANKSFVNASELRLIVESALEDDAQV
mgnify:CR=1 FL=1